MSAARHSLGVGAGAVDQSTAPAYSSELLYFLSLIVRPDMVRQTVLNAGTPEEAHEHMVNLSVQIEGLEDTMAAVNESLMAVAAGIALTAVDASRRMNDLFGDPHDARVWGAAAAESVDCSNQMVGRSAVRGVLSDAPIRPSTFVPSPLPYVPMPDIDLDFSVPDGEPPLAVRRQSNMQSFMKNTWERIALKYTLHENRIQDWERMLLDWVQSLPGPAKRARQLIKSTLPYAVWEQYCRDGFILVQSQARGFSYRIHQEPSPDKRVDLLRDGRPFAGLCCAPNHEERMPWEDVLLLQYIALRCDEQNWASKANAFNDYTIPPAIFLETVQDWRDDLCAPQDFPF